MRNPFIFIVITLLFPVAAAAGADTSGPTEKQRENIETNIKRAREALGERLATTADDVIAGHVRAVGGRDALEAIETLTLRGRNIILSDEVRPIERFCKSPDLLRQQTPGSSYHLLCDGEKLWGVDGSEKTEMNFPWAKELIHNRIDGNFLDYRERGIEYEYLGLHGFWTEPTVMYHLRRTFPDGHVEHLYFDVKSGLLRAFDVPQASGPSAFRVFYDYREVGGILFPHMWMRIFGEKTPPHVFIVDEITVNASFPAGFFGED